MRISRYDQLHEPNGTVHFFWRCHNKEKKLDTEFDKSIYMDCLVSSLERENLSYYGKVKIHSYTVMGNHFHAIITYEESAENLSNFTRRAHGCYGHKYNKEHKKSGSVTDGRFKTSLIENSDHEMRVHFYVEANPIRAGIATIDNLHRFRFSSYKFYAYGISDEYSKYLTIPEWYLNLGKTPFERRKKYRKLFRQYLNENAEFKLLRKEMHARFIGTIIWRELQNSDVLARTKTAMITFKVENSS